MWYYAIRAPLRGGSRGGPGGQDHSPPFGGPPNCILRGKTSRMCAQKRRILVLITQAAFPNGPQSGPSGAHLGPIWGPTGAHMECCLGSYLDPLPEILHPPLDHTSNKKVTFDIQGKSFQKWISEIKLLSVFNFHVFFMSVGGGGRFYPREHLASISHWLINSNSELAD